MSRICNKKTRIYSTYDNNEESKVRKTERERERAQKLNVFKYLWDPSGIFDIESLSISL